jgi:hypothetical protein
MIAGFTKSCTGSAAAQRQGLALLLLGHRKSGQPEPVHEQPAQQLAPAAAAATPTLDHLREHEAAPACQEHRRHRVHEQRRREHAGLTGSPAPAAIHGALQKPERARILLLLLDLLLLPVRLVLGVQQRRRGRRRLLPVPVAREQLLPAAVRVLLAPGLGEALPRRSEVRQLGRGGLAALNQGGRILREQVQARQSRLSQSSKDESRGPVPVYQENGLGHH